MGQESFEGLQARSELGDGRCSIGLIEDGAGDDEPIHAGIARRSDGLSVEAPVHFEPLMCRKALLHFACLGQNLRHELLAGEARHHAHHEHDVDKFKSGIDGFDRRSWV